MKRYPAYRDSGVEWLGEVPSHWVVLPLKRELAFLTSGSRGWAEHYADEGDLFIRIANLTRDSARLDLQDVQFVKVPEGAEGERTKVQPKDVLFSITAYIGSVAVVPPAIGPAYVSQHIALARLREGRLLPEWLGYFTLSSAGSRLLEIAGYGGTKIQLSLEDIASLPVLVPPLDDQVSAVAFLDRETAKIDALIAEQEKLIALLAEKRQATISHAVTRGLDPDVPMKDSGVPWLGDVPAHWDTCRVKTLTTFITSGPRGWSERIAEEGSLFIQSGDLDDAMGIDFSGAKRVVVEHDAETARTRLRQGDVVVCITGAKTGNVAVCDGVGEDAYVNQHLCLLRPAKAVQPRYLALALKADAGRVQLDVAQYGLKQGLNLDDLSNVWIAFGPPEEQSRILASVDRAASVLDDLADEATRAISLLRERRSALITAAVTGQIDVRGLVADTASRAIARERVLG